MQQRYYDPIAGRFLSVDPVVTDDKDGSFFNRYLYGNGNPYRFKDKDGRAPDDLAPIQHPIVPVLKDIVAGATAMFPSLATPPSSAANLVTKTTVIVGPFEASKSTSSSGSSSVFVGFREPPASLSFQQTVESKLSVGDISGPTLKLSGNFGLPGGIGAGGGVDLSPSGVQMGAGFVGRGSPTGGVSAGLGTPGMAVGWTFKLPQ